MGLLDDAIREHLELKRLRGADPGAVAREQQDALGPVRREPELEGQQDSEARTSPDTDGSSPQGSESLPVADSSTGGQETVEFNMDLELDTETDSRHETKATQEERSAPMNQPAHTQATTEESLEWEVPGDRPDESASSGNADARADDDHEGTEHIEDVLEETPDFLRDTPEQERLWFEQRPPRDFDFNE
jgi:hypothetical protein